MYSECVCGFGRVNSLTLGAAKRGLTILDIFHLQRYFLENIWRRNVDHKPDKNSPSNILRIFALFKRYFQKYDSSRQHFLEKLQVWMGLRFTPRQHDELSVLKASCIFDHHLAHIYVCMVLCVMSRHKRIYLCVWHWKVKTLHLIPQSNSTSCLWHCQAQYCSIHLSLCFLYKLLMHYVAPNMAASQGLNRLCVQRHSINHKCFKILINISPMDFVWDCCIIPFSNISKYYPFCCEMFRAVETRKLQRG